MRDAGQQLEPADLLPHPRHGARIQHLQLELAEPLGDGAAVQLHQHGERRDLPHGGLDPGALEGQLVLVALALEAVGGKAEGLEPGDELGGEHLPLAVEHVAAQEGGFASRERQRADVVELLLQLADVDQLREFDRSGAVEDAEGDLGIAVAAKDRLRHQQLVEVGVEHRAHDGIDLPVVIVDAGGDVGHGRYRMVGPCGRSPGLLASGDATRSCVPGATERPGRGGMPGVPLTAGTGGACQRLRHVLPTAKGPGAKTGAACDCCVAGRAGP